MGRSSSYSTSDQRGMALLIVVSVISVLSIVVIRFNKTTQSSMERGFYYQDDVVLVSMVQSGMDIGGMILDTDGRQNSVDSLVESWADLESKQLGSLFDQGTLRVRVVDLSGRFPINRLVENPSGSKDPGTAESEGSAELYRLVLQRLLINGDFGIESEVEAMEIVDSLTDWLDGDDDISPYGAENSYYLTMDTPYIARNGPVEFIDELLQVKGITPEILYGSGEKKGLSEYINIYGADRININTAPNLLFQSLAAGVSVEDVVIVDEFRRNENSALLLSTADWYRSVIGWPGDVILEDALIATTSNRFKIYAEAQYRTSKMSMSADVLRVDEGVELYYRNIE